MMRRRSWAGRRAAAPTVRMGPLSLFALVVIVCMAVLAVLAVSTANATLAMSERVATSTDELYRNEAAAQVFVADVDERLATLGGRATGESAARAVEADLAGMAARAEDEAGGAVTAQAQMEGRTVKATFASPNGRVLKVELYLQDDLTCRIDRWKMAAVEYEEQPTGTLWTGA